MSAPDPKVLKMAGRAVQSAVKTLAAGGDILPEAAKDAMQEIMRGEASQAQMGAYLALLNLDRCTPGVVHACADVMRANATPVEVPGDAPVVDIVGTGGDGQDTFNISTAAALVVAGAGVAVVKHGNRAASSKSGAADILEALGARLELAAAEVPDVLSKSGFVFLFARSYHPAMKHVGPVRAQLGIRTIFNILGPLTNPAKPNCCCIGVFAPRLGRLFAEVYKMLGMSRALVVHGVEGLDELSIAGPSKVWELCPDGNIKEYEVSPADFGLEAHPLSEVAGGTPEENAKEMRELLVGRGRAAVRDMVLMNAGASLYAAGKAADLKEGVNLAREAMTNGKASAVIDNYVAATATKP
mmetsp:Transcript_102932/g.193658  ORF Transcript_102932/g.193658 Transcript_102932/m.193658 type:complete len:356 (-) Transcript_102932:19-1086(-)